MSSMFLTKSFVVLLIAMALMAGTHAAYAADSPAEAEQDVENATTNATANITADNAMNRTTIRVTERTFAISEWWAPRFYPYTKYVPYLVSQLLLGIVATSPLTAALVRILRSIRGEEQ